jgi:hypothetical protein
VPAATTEVKSTDHARRRSVGPWWRWHFQGQTRNACVMRVRGKGAISGRTWKGEALGVALCCVCTARMTVYAVRSRGMANRAVGFGPALGDDAGASTSPTYPPDPVSSASTACNRLALLLTNSPITRQATAASTVPALDFAGPTLVQRPALLSRRLPGPSLAPRHLHFTLPPTPSRAIQSSPAVNNRPIFCNSLRVEQSQNVG